MGPGEKKGEGGEREKERRRRKKKRIKYLKPFFFISFVSLIT